MIAPQRGCIYISDDARIDANHAGSEFYRTVLPNYALNSGAVHR